MCLVAAHLFHSHCLLQKRYTFYHSFLLILVSYTRLDYGQLQKEEKQSVDVKQFLSVVRKYTNLTELTPEIVHEFIDKIIVHAPDKSSGKRLQEIEIIYNHIGVFDHSKVTLWKGKAV